MAEFNLEVEMTARTDELEKAFKKAQTGAEKTADKMDEAGSSGTAGLGKIATAAAAVMASMAALEIGVGLAGAAMSLFSGDSEKVRASLSSLPIFGGLITKFYEFGDALEYASIEAQRARKNVFELEQAANDLGVTIGDLSAKLSLFEQVAKLQGQSELAIANKVFQERDRLISLERGQRLKALDEENMARLQAIHDLKLEEEDANRLYEKARETKYEQLAAIEENIRLQRELNSLQRMEVLEQVEEKEKKEIEAAESAAEAKKKADREAFRQQMEDEALRLAAQMSGLAKVEQARKEAAKAEKARREEIAENEAAARKKMGEIQKKIDEQRASALKAIQGMTSTFDTAGGSFTTGVKAQLDNSKILNKLSGESRDFLAQIVQNTARMVTGVGGFA